MSNSEPRCYIFFIEDIGDEFVSEEIEVEIRGR
jgi:hypothetical protein